MNVASFILVIVAVVFFLADSLAARRVVAFSLTPLGLACLAAAWTLQLTWHTIHIVHFN